MSFGENLQFYRKMENITQEQMAEKMQVSRQTISKWEAGTSYPEMEKIMQLCEMFSCSMDTLMRGDARQDYVRDTADYDRHMNLFSKEMAAGVGTAGLGIALVNLLDEMTGLAGKLSDIIFLPFLILAVAVFVVSGIQHSHFTKKNPFISDFYTQEEKEAFERRFPILIATGVCCALLGLVASELESILPAPFNLPAEGFYDSIFILFVVLGAMILMHTGMQKSKYNIEEYNKSHDPRYADCLRPEEQALLEKRRAASSTLVGKCCACIMIIAATIYLLWSFLAAAWSVSWLVFPVAALLCGAAAVIFGGGEK